MDELYMKEALKEANKAFEKGDVPVGAVIVKDGKVLSRAYNKKEETKDVTDHAEIIAIRKACKAIDDWRLNGCTIYVTLEPCAMCMGAIQQARIEKVVYGTKNINDNTTKKIDLTSGTLENECSDILKTFFQNRRNS